MSLKTSVTLTCLSFALGIAAAQRQDFSKIQIKVSKVAGNVYVPEGAGGNIGAAVGDDGIVLVDDQEAALGEKIQAALKGINDKPVRFIINTHYHGDHVSGNAYFQKQAAVIAHDNVPKRLQTGGTTGNGGSMHFQASPQSLSSPMCTTCDSGKKTMESPSVWPAGKYCTPTAIILHLNGEDINVEAGGSLTGMINAVESVIAQVPADVKVIPGHVQLSDLDDLKDYLTMLKATREAVAR